MTNSILLNNVTHKNLRINTRRGAAWGDDMMSAVVFPDEFRNVQAHYPIVFQKSADGTGFQSIALFGFREGKNLFLDSKGWDAHYLPMSVERLPFMIGIDGEELLVHVDMDSPRIINGIGTEEEVPVFLPHGGNTEFLDRMSSLLLAVHEGVQATPAFIQALLTHNLLESFVLDIELPDGSSSRLAGLYTIAEERLAALEAKALESLHRAGYTQAIYMVVASMSHLRDLIERQNRQIVDEGKAA